MVESGDVVLNGGYVDIEGPVESATATGTTTTAKQQVKTTKLTLYTLQETA